MSRRFTVSVPASSANLGPGFDAIGLALELRMTATVDVLDGGATPRWSFSGDQTPTHDGLRDEIARGTARIAGPAVLPPLSIAVDNAIPLGRGLGGSAAGAALGVAIGALLLASRPPERDLARAIAEIEGHPDNGIPALVGGIVVAAQSGDELEYVRFAPPPGMRAVVVVPEIEMPTVQARAILPMSYSRRDAVYNVQRAALLAAAFAGGRSDLLAAAMRDRLHQPYRAAFVPGLLDTVTLSGDGILGIALSGAGPSIIALVDGDGTAALQRLVAAFAAHGVPSRGYALAIAADGVRWPQEG